MTPPARDPGLERQRAQVEAEFRHGRVPAAAGQPRTLSAADVAEARRILDPTAATSRLTYLDPETLQAIRDGAQPGDPLPPLRRKPLIDQVSDDVEVIIAGEDRPFVAVLFSHDRFPGIRFGHRLAPPTDELARYETGWLAEEIGTGALHRMMRDPPAPDPAGLTWTTWRPLP